MKLDDNFVFAHRYYMVINYNTSGVKEQNPPACGRIYSFQNVTGAAPF
jgi:hypothetical protein